MSEEDFWEGASCAETVSVAGFQLPKHDPDLWFEPIYEFRAKVICEDCPLRLKCLEYSVKNKMLDGVWGGFNPTERKLLKKGR